MTPSLSASSIPVSSRASIPRSTKVSEFGATGGAAIGIWVIQGCRSSMSRCTSCPFPQSLPPRGSSEHQVSSALRARVPHELEKLVFVGDVAVQRHGGEAQLLGHPGHRDRLEAFGVSKTNGGGHDRVDGENGLGAASSRLAASPQQIESRRERRRLAARRIIGAGLRVHALDYNCVVHIQFRV